MRPTISKIALAVALTCGLSAESTLAANLLDGIPWTITGSAGDHNGQDGVYVWAPYVAGVTGTVSKKVATIPGNSYAVSFGIHGNRVEGGIISAAFGGVTGYGREVWPQGSLSAGPASATFSVVAAQASSTFSFTGEGLYGIFFLDNASVVDLGRLVPPPISGCDSLGFGGSVSVVPIGSTMTASFTPRSGGTSLSSVAAGCGWKGFNWQQRIVSLPINNPYRSNANPDKPLFAPPAFLDPVPTGYTYKGSVDNSFPFYYDSANLLPIESGLSALNFRDTPANPWFLPGQYIEFITDLVPVLDGNVPGKPLFEFAWRSNFNGTSGKVARLNNDGIPDLGSGTGGVTLLYATPVPELPITWLLATSLPLVGAAYARRKRRSDTSNNVA